MNATMDVRSCKARQGKESNNVITRVTESGRNRNESSREEAELVRAAYMMSREGHYLGRRVMEMEVGTSEAEETNG